MQTIKLLNQDTVLLSQPQLIKEFGRSTAQLLCQLNYWLNKEQGAVIDGVRWIYNTAEQWAEQLSLSSRQVERIVDNLIKRGVIRVAKLSPIKQVRVNYFTLDHDRLNEIINASKTSQNSSEPTHKNTSDCAQKISNIGHISPVTIANVHSDILSESSRQNVGMLLQRLTNKDKNNKSEAFDAVESETTTIENAKIPSQVQQVENIKFDFVEVEKEEEGATPKFLEDVLKPSSTEAPVENSQESSPESSSESCIPNTTVQDMIGIWNAAFPNSPEKLSKLIAPMLVAAFKTRFENNMDKFKNYCALIQSSPYLMGEGFSLKLEWAMKFKTIDRLLNGELGVKKIEFKPAESSQQDKAQGHINAVNEPDDCKDTRRMLVKALGVDSYLSWFTQVDFVHRNGQIQMRSHNRFIQDQIEARFGEMLGITIVVA